MCKTILTLTCIKRLTVYFEKIPWSCQDGEYSETECRFERKSALMKTSLMLSIWPQPRPLCCLQDLCENRKLPLRKTGTAINSFSLKPKLMYWHQKLYFISGNSLVRHDVDISGICRAFLMGRGKVWDWKIPINWSAPRFRRLDSESEHKHRQSGVRTRHGGVSYAHN